MSVLAVVVLTACSSETRHEASQASVLDAYRLSWGELIAAGDPIDPDDPNLRLHRDGQALEEIVAILRAYKEQGLVYRGSVDINPEITEFAGDRAKIKDCTLDRTEVINPATGQVVRPADTRPKLTTTTMELQAGTWKAVNFVPENKECTPPG